MGCICNLHCIIAPQLRYCTEYQNMLRCIARHFIACWCGCLFAQSTATRGVCAITHKLVWLECLVALITLGSLFCLSMKHQKILDIRNLNLSMEKFTLQTARHAFSLLIMQNILISANTKEESIIMNLTSITMIMSGGTGCVIAIARAPICIHYPRCGGLP